MPEPTDGQKEVAELQKRILGLEETIASLKSKSDDSKTAQNKIIELEKKLEAAEKEKAEIQSHIWDKKERRAKERRAPGERESEKKTVPDHEGDPWGGPLA
jgi:hypothetical protein